MLFQLCNRDEYGRDTIISTGDDISKLVSKARLDVSDENFNNSYTIDEQKKNFECAFVEVMDKNGKATSNVFYAGKRGNGTDYVYILSKDGKKVEEKNLVGSDYKLRFYIGENVIDRKNNVVDKYYITSSGRKGQNKEVDSMSAQELEGKTLYFVRKVR